MKKCLYCDKSINDDAQWCMHCGKEVKQNNNSSDIVNQASSSTISQSSTTTTSVDNEVNKKIFKTLVIVFVLLILAFVVAYSSAKRWTKVDKAAYDEPSYQVPTGTFTVYQSRTDNCYIGENWYDCINKKVTQYNSCCVNRSLSTWGRSVCDAYGKEIDRMKSLGNSYSYVSTLGSYGNLSVEEDYETIKGKHHNAETHEAVCYLGFIGECN